MTMTTVRRADRGDRIERMQDSLQRSMRVEEFLNDPVIVRMFEFLKKTQIDVMVNAAAHDDETRRGAALKVQAIRDVYELMLSTAQSREKLEQKLEEMTGHGA